MTHCLYNHGTVYTFTVVDDGVEVGGDLMDVDTARGYYRELLDFGASKTPPAPVGSFAATARFMARGDRSGFDWDAWKDDMKDRR